MSKKKLGKADTKIYDNKAKFTAVKLHTLIQLLKSIVFMKVTKYEAKLAFKMYQV